MSIVEQPQAAARSAPADFANRRQPVTLAMYDRMIAAGVFDPAENHPLELIGGDLHVMSPIGDRHADAVAFLTRWVAFRRYADRRPQPAEVSLLIEVADTSLAFDTEVKAGLYAAAGITDYWVVDLISRGVIVFRDPRAGRYETRSTHRDDNAVRPLAQPSAVLMPVELFATE
jgi:Uma2 family endonuclease